MGAGEVNIKERILQRRTKYSVLKGKNEVTGVWITHSPWMRARRRGHLHHHHGCLRGPRRRGNARPAAAARSHAPAPCPGGEVTCSRKALRRWPTPTPELTRGRRHINPFALSYRVLAADALAKLTAWVVASASASARRGPVLAATGIPPLRHAGSGIPPPPPAPAASVQS
jgi:hypothetical protein